MQNVPIQSVRGNDRNPRKLDKEKFQKLVQSIKDFPEMLEKRPLVVADGVILGGNMRHKAAIEAGLKEIPIIDASEWTDKQKEQFIIKDNLSFGEWDWDVLANEWDPVQLEEWGLDVWQMPKEEPETFTDPDDVPELPIEATTQPGDIYVLGKHRVMCGDSTNPEHVARLMDGQKADLCFTSPPYLQQRDYTKEGKEKVQDWDALMCGVFANLQMKPKGQVLVNLGLVHRNNEWVPYWETWIEWMRSEGWNRFGWYVWDSGHGLPGDWMGRFAPSHEFVFHFNKEAEKPKHIVDKKPENIKEKKGLGMRQKDGKVRKITSGHKGLNEKKISDSVLRVTREHGKIRSEHPATFSVEFAEVFVQSWPGLVYEPFLGSGTTLIAAEQNAQPCFGMEISPNYCDVIVKRWEDFTGKKAERVSKA